MSLNVEPIFQIKVQAARGRQIIRVLAKYGFANWVSGIPLPLVRSALPRASKIDLKDRTREERIRLALNELGTTYIKLGQMLATRPDLVGPDLARELSKLQTGTQPDSSSTARAAIKRELGKTPEQLFDHFDGKPFASASIAQVHRARLFSGEQVVVKIQKQGVRDTVEQDLAIMAHLARLVEAHNPDPPALLRQSHFGKV